MLKPTIIAALSLLALATPASSQQSPGALVATQQGNGDAVASLPAFASAIDSTGVAVPHLRSHCRVDTKSAPWGDIAAAFNEGGTLFAMTVDCPHVEGKAKGSANLEMMFYASSKDAPTSPDKGRAAKQDCDIARSSGTFRNLRSTKANDRLAELEALVTSSGEQSARAIIDATKRACYFAFATKKGERLILSVGATTQIKGRSVTITAMSLNGTDLVKLRQRIGTVVAALSQQNGEA